MFNFGLNWLEYSAKALDQTRLKQAIVDLDSLVGAHNIKDKTFLDLGCGSGIHSIAAAELGAKKVYGVDISAESILSSKENLHRFPTAQPVTFKQASLLDMTSRKEGKFDVVYSWGVLHHTGNMNKAISVASELVADKGFLILAIYNRHWSSLGWWYIKKIYNNSPKVIQQLLVQLFAGVIALAKFIVTGKNPFLKKRRGMTFYYDVIDWLGGFPYEYASKEELISLVEPQGFILKKFIPAQVPTGCHEYVFRKK